MARPFHESASTAITRSRGSVRVIFARSAPALLAHVLNLSGEAPTTATVVDSPSVRPETNLLRQRIPAAVSTALVALAIPAFANAEALPGAHISAAPQDLAKAADYPGPQHLHFKYGPINIAPGQNTLAL